jgi:hypothetical protein
MEKITMSDTPAQFMARTPQWHLKEAAAITTSAASFNGGEAMWALVRQQAITNHLLWAVAKRGESL